MDALSEALTTVRMTGAIFFNAEFTSPWGFISPPAEEAIPSLSPGAEWLVLYHLVTEGKAVVQIEDEEELLLGPGDIVIVPHGHPHKASSGAPTKWLKSEQLGSMRDLSVVRYGGGGEATRFVCGYLSCERASDRLFLAGLPRLFKVNIRGDASGAWLENSIRHLVAEMISGRPGGMALLSKTAEALFIETLRRYMEQMPPQQAGWLAAARDPIVGAALALLHRKPCHPWTMADLSDAVGASRSVLAERFARFLGEPPLTYLARWRMQLAARKLQMTRDSIVSVGLEVGYESEAAFNRAFKREFGLPPARYRRNYLGQGIATSGRERPDRNGGLLR